ncbi:uncharacterized protein M6B38_113135 [Iris pallida]|uniref:Uncharacterized protein n=1 Tax=Iris pallida TaxID=29817 RepID=A0AAX6IKU1_IRIPA|nr:uncharacterized protein M6B38_113135 [Iris pallida]
MVSRLSTIPGLWECFVCKGGYNVWNDYLISIHFVIES